MGNPENVGAIVFWAMTRGLIYAALVSTAVAAQAFGQTTVTPSTVTNRGVVALGNSSTSLTATTTGVNASPAALVQSTSSTSTGTTATGSTPGTAPTGGASGGGSASKPSSASPSTASRAASSASSAGSSGSATGVALSKVPNWLLCSPSGASGMEPFLAGTSLSCAP
jgi:hypothetical protein